MRSLLFSSILLLTCPLAAQAQSSQWVCYAIGSAKIAPGAGYAPGVYKNVALSGGAGADAAADVAVDATGKVVDIAIEKPGHDFRRGDVLTASMGSSGAGFSLTVSNLNSFHPDATPGNEGIKKRGPSPCYRALPEDASAMIQHAPGTPEYAKERERAAIFCHGHGAEKAPHPDNAKHPDDPGSWKSIETGKWLPGWEGCSVY